MCEERGIRGVPDRGDQDAPRFGFYLLQYHRGCRGDFPAEIRTADGIVEQAVGQLGISRDCRFDFAPGIRICQQAAFELQDQRFGIVDFEE